MAVGYSARLSTITAGATILAAHFNTEYDAIVNAFHATTGHNHDGTVGGGALISLASSVTSTLPVANGGSGAVTHTDGGLLIGKGTAAFANTGVLADGTVVIGDGATNPTTLAAFTSATGTLKHEYGGVEANISAVTVGQIVVGTGTGSMGLGSYPINRNLLLNGEMKVAQRGTTITSPASNNYLLDQWKLTSSGTGVMTVTQSTTVPNAQFVNSMKVDVTTADASITATDRYVLLQNVEGLRCSRIGFGGSSAQSLTLSFWVRVDSAALTFPAIFTGAIQNSAQNRTYPFTYSVTASATWQKITITLAGDITGTWLQTSGIGLRLALCLDIGTDYHGTASAWAASDRYGTSAQVNFMGNTANDMYLTGVQLEVGSVATPFENLDYGEELRLCRRYFYRIKVSTNSDYAGIIHTVNTTRALSIFPNTPMRATPTATLAGAVPVGAGWTAGTVVSVNGVFQTIDGSTITIHWVTTSTVAFQDAALQFTTAASDYIDLSAEL